MRAARARASPVDPRSGPSRGERPSFFHLGASWIVAEPGRIVGLHVSNYINRLDDLESGRDRLDSREAAMDCDPVGVRTSAYIGREDRDEHGELGAHVLIGRGLPVRTGAQLARLLDARERKADRTYRCYGGRLPRVATHLIASFRFGVTHAQASAILADFAQALSDRLQVPIEGQVHNKEGRPDHIHLLIGTRIVVRGKLGKKCRALDAVSEKADGQAIEVGDRLIGVTMEWMRSEWAARMRDATGDMAVDHRSYARLNLDIVPVTHVPRADIEYERRRGTNDWRDRRRRELATRVGVLSGVQSGVAAEPILNREVPAPDQAIAPTDVEQRAQTLLGVLTASTSVEERGMTAESAADELADLLGLQVPGGALSELLRQRERADVRRRAELLLGTLTPSTTIMYSGTVGKAADDLADLLGRQIPGEAIQELLRQRMRSKIRDVPVDAFAKPTDVGAVLQSAANTVIDPIGLRSSSGAIRELPMGTTRARSQVERAASPDDPDTDRRRKPPIEDATKGVLGEHEGALRSRSSDAVSRDPQLDQPAAGLPATTPTPPIDLGLPARPIIPDSRSENPIVVPIQSSRVVDEGAGVGRLDGRYAAKGPARAVGSAPEKSHKQENAHVSGGRTLQPSASTTSLESRPTRSEIEQRSEIERRIESHPDQHHAIAMVRALRHQRRLTASRIQTLAASVDMDSSRFEAVAIADGPPEPMRDETIDRLPPYLSQLWRQWAQEENEARRLRRAEAKSGDERLSPNPSATFNPIETANLDHISRRDASAVSRAGGGPVKDEQSPIDRRDAAVPMPPSAGPEPRSNQTVGEPTADGIEPTRAPSPDPIARALVGAFARDVQTQAKRLGKIPSPRALERGIAVRLRVTGRTRAEVEAILLSASDPTKVDLAKERIVEAAAYAFSDAMDLQRRTVFAARIETIETQTEALVYRRLRRQALDKLRHDLDAVWVERRMRADEAARRHARRLKLLHELRWRTNRARRRSPIVVAILSALVEIAVLRPLITRQKALAAAERRAIDAAAERASSELKRLRQEWHEKGYRARGSRKGSKEAAQRSAAAQNSVADSDSWVAALNPDIAGEHRQIVIGVALVMAAQGVWSDRDVSRLSRLIGTNTNELWSLVCDACRRHHGHVYPRRLGPAQISQHWTAARQGAATLRWDEALDLMTNIAGGREPGDDRGGPGR